MNAPAPWDGAHIREKLPPVGGNQYYKDKSVRTARTLCGAVETAQDWMLATARAKKWNAAAQSLCPRCLEIAGVRHA